MPPLNKDLKKVINILFQNKNETDEICPIYAPLQDRPRTLSMCENLLSFFVDQLQTNEAAKKIRSFVRKCYCIFDFCLPPDFVLKMGLTDHLNSIFFFHHHDSGRAALLGKTLISSSSSSSLGLSRDNQTQATNNNYFIFLCVRRLSSLFNSHF